MSIETRQSYDVRPPTTAPAASSDRDVAPTSPGLFRKAYHDTLGRPSAWVGLSWLFLLAFFAVFAPFLATSHPLLMKMNGKWSSPVLHHLAPADVMLLIAATAVVVLWTSRRFSVGVSALVVVLILAVCATPVYVSVRPPVNEVFESTREDIAAGRVERVWLAPVPFSPRDRLREQSDARLRPPSRAHWAGTDTNGADVFSLLLHASRIALSIGFIATSISVVIGIIIGGIMGYFAGTVDLLGMRLIEIFEAIPLLFLLISITAFIQQRNIYLMMAVLGATSWTGYARFLRAEFFTIRKLDYVQAAIAAGLPNRIILFRHMLANALTPILVSTTFGVGSAILFESILSFLGIGLIDQASWGAMLEQARAGGAGFIWWIALFPGAAIFLTVFAYNLVGEAIRDALDPKLRKRD